MKGFLADCRHGLRLYVRTPFASLIAVCVLAAAMAFVVAFLSLYVDLVLRPHPGFEQSHRIATVAQNFGMQSGSPGATGLPYEVVERMSEEMTSIEAAASLGSARAVIEPDGVSATAAMVSEEFFTGLRPRVALGRGFRVEDHAPDAEPVLVLSPDYWRERFDSDPNVIGTVLEISSNPASLSLGMFGRGAPEQETAQFRIVGVMSESVSGLAVSDPDLWVPLERAWRVLAGAPESLPAFTGTGIYVRRALGVSATAVANELRSRYEGADSPLRRIPGSRLDAIEGIVRDFAVQRDARRQLEMFLAGSLLVAVVGAANISLFLLARAPGRRRELGIRLAVGAPIKRLARQLATEAGLLVVISAVLGLLGSVWLSLYLPSLAFLREAGWTEVTLLDWRVLSLAGAVLLVLTVLVSLAPVIGLKRLGIAASSQRVTARASLAQRLAGTTQIAVAGTLGAAALALGWHLGSIMFGSPGYETANRYAVEGLTGALPLPATNEQIALELARRREAIEALPGVTSAAFGGPVPGGLSGFIPLPVSIPHPSDPANEIEVYRGALDDRFIDVLGLELLHGRAPEEGEVDRVLVNQTLARALWGRDDVVGERLPGNVIGRAGAEIIGVLKDLSFEHPSAAVRPYVFLSASHGGLETLAILETQMSTTELWRELERLRALGRLEAEVRDIRPLEAMRIELIPADRARGFLTITLAIVVVLLAAFGFYGTQRYLVTAGRREYAIRASLGAGPRALWRLVFGRGLWLGVPGVVVGALLAFIVVAYLRGDVVSRDIAPGPVALWVIAGLVLLILAASVGPARQAKRTQPAPLLRED